MEDVSPPAESAVTKAESENREKAVKYKKAARQTQKPYDIPLWTGKTLTEDQAVAAAERAQLLLSDARAALRQVIFGQETVSELVLTAILAGGHALLTGVPGLAKTKLAESLGIVLGLSQKRIQFTPDLMPADIIGSEVMEENAKGKRGFRYIKGPVFTQLLMADEINRAGPRTQAALLQAMQEYHVTIAGKRYDLPRPFHVLATQNPLEQEGTYPLPEAQRDRFLMQIDITYPDIATERQIVLSTTMAEPKPPQPALSAERLQEMQQLIRIMPLPENVLDAILNLARACRPPESSAEEELPLQEKTAPAKLKAITGLFAAERAEREGAELQRFIAWGPGPRAQQALALCVRARALLQGRFAPALADVRALARPILQHRMALNFTARAENIYPAAIIDYMMQKIITQE